MRTTSSLQIIRDIARGRMEITIMNSRDGAQVTIYADRLVAIVAATILPIAIAILIAPAR
jgi:hypothetical protein